MRESHTLTRQKVLAAMLFGSLGLAGTGQVKAVQFEFGEDSEVSGRLDVTLGYAASVRASDAEQESLNPSNSLLGTGTTPNYLSHARVPDSGDLISNVFKGTFELGLDWRNVGVVSSATYQYDTEIMNDKAVDFMGNRVPWSEAAEDYAGNYWELLDAYAYGEFDFAGNPLDVRVGKQVINWGEGLYFIDGVSTQVPLNYNKLVTPGSELKEAYIGVNSLYAQMGLGSSASIAAYVQSEWRRAEFGPRGTFYGDDVLFRGGTEVDPLLGVPIRDRDEKASDSGQWGISSRVFVTEDLELGVYYSRYHETVPFLQLTVPGSDKDLGSAIGIHQVWPEDVDMFGLSMATTVGTWSVNGEMAFRPDRPLFSNLVTFDEQGRNVEEHDTVNASIHGVWLGGALPLGIDSQTAFVQLGADYIDGDLDNLMAQYSVETPGAPDDLAYGVAAEWNGTWNAVYPGTNLTLGLFLQRDLEGNSHFWGNFVEDRTLGTVSLTANTGNALETRLGYNWVKQDNPHYDTQDTVNLSVNYKL